MSENTAKKQKVSSPASTGGAGTFFEQHVGAHWLSLLLVRAIPPILLDSRVLEVHFQAERLDWNTDDFIVVGENGSGVRRKLIGQVKRSFTVSSSDEECKKAIKDYWLDFRNEKLFSQVSDRFALRGGIRDIRQCRQNLGRLGNASPYQNTSSNPLNCQQFDE